MLVAMPNGQAQLHQTAPGTASDASSDLTRLLPSPPASAVRPPLSARILPAGGVRAIVLPPRRQAAMATGRGPLAGRIPSYKSGIGTPVAVAAAARRGMAGVTAVVSHQVQNPGVGGAAAPVAVAPVPRQPDNIGVFDDDFEISPVSVAAAVRYGTSGDCAPTAGRGGAAPLPIARRGGVATAPLEPSSPMVPTASLTPRVAETSSGGAHRPSFFARPLQTRPAGTEAQPRALTFRVSRKPAAEEETAGGRSLTPAVSPAPPNAQMAIRKAAKPRAKRGAKKNATAAPTGAAAGGARGSLALPPTAESQSGGTPLAPPPPVHPVGERPASSVVTASTLTTVFAEGLRPVCVHLAGLSKKLDEVHDSVNRLSINLHTQGMGNERTAQAVVQLQRAVKGVYDGVVPHSKQEPVAAGTLRGSTAMPEDYEEQL